MAVLLCILLVPLCLILLVWYWCQRRSLKSAAKQLRELEADGFLLRHDFQEIPPRVEYTLSDLGLSFIDVIAYMKAWGDRNLPDM